MSESQNNNQDPNNVDDEQNRTAGASAPLDVSGSFQLAQNPEQFFQGSIPASENDSMQTRSFSFASSQFNPDPSAQPFDPNVVTSEPSPSYTQQPPANYNSLPEPSASYTPPADVQQPTPAMHPGSASHPDSSGAFNPDPAAEFQGGDFFDNSGRQAQNPQSYASQPQVFGQSDQQAPDPGIIPNAPATPMRPQSSNDRRLPGGFFDVQENAAAGTTGSAVPASPAANQFNQNYHPGVTAQQAFFAGNDVPQLPAPKPQQGSSFQDFLQDPSPTASAPTQQPAGPTAAPTASGAFPQFQQGQSQQQNQQQLQNQQLQNQAAQAAQYPPAQAQYPSAQGQNPLLPPQPNTAQNAPPNQNTVRLTQNDSSAQSPSAPLPNASAPTGRKKRRRRRLEDDEPVTDYTQSEVEMDTFKRFEKLVVNPETKGLTMLAFHDARQVLTQPEEFFKAMQTRGNIAEPAIFLFILAGVSGLLAGVISMNLLITIQFVIGNVLQAYLLSLICSKMYTGMGSTEPFETSFRVVAYSQATLIIAGLKFSIFGNWIPAYITLLIATLLALRIQIAGMKQVHDMPANKVTPVLVLATLFILLIRFKTFLL